MSRKDSNWVFKEEKRKKRDFDLYREHIEANEDLKALMCKACFTALCLPEARYCYKCGYDNDPDPEELV